MDRKFLCTELTGVGYGSLSKELQGYVIDEEELRTRLGLIKSNYYLEHAPYRSDIEVLTAPKPEPKPEVPQYWVCPDCHVRMPRGGNQFPCGKPERDDRITEIMGNIRELHRLAKEAMVGKW